MKVLVVDDDRAVSALICDVLRNEGFDCTYASGDMDAYRIIPSLPSLAALVVDVNLGEGTTGFDVARFARTAIPDLLVIYVTGQGTPDSVRTFGVPGSELVLKPFSPADLTEVFRRRVALEPDRF